ncbi:MAG: hypothetical protein U1E51_17615 [Candidatus Binatia bacterium]|nr:hypothetical protein [Candidatus Binatia bacterium]
MWLPTIANTSSSNSEIVQRRQKAKHAFALMNKSLLLGLIGLGFFLLSGAVTWWNNRLPADQKNSLFAVLLVLLWGVFLLGVYLHPVITR